MPLIKSDTTQEKRILNALVEARGGWVDGRYFLEQMFLSQYHRALWNLMHRPERYNYVGQIEISDFKDQFGFKSYRLVINEPTYRPFSDKISTKAYKVSKYTQERLFRLRPINY